MHSLVLIYSSRYVFLEIGSMVQTPKTWNLRVHFQDQNKNIDDDLKILRYPMSNRRVFALFSLHYNQIMLIIKFKRK